MGKYRSGQLMEDGHLGQCDGFSFVRPEVVIDNLRRTGCDALVTVGLPFRNPVVSDEFMDNKTAIGFVRAHADKYVFEAYHNGDGMLHIGAVSENDCF